MSNGPPVALRIGFIGVGKQAFAMAADPNAGAVAIIFSAVEQLRRYFEQHPRSICREWVEFFHELGAANVQDARERDDQQQQQQQQSTSSFSTAGTLQRKYASALVQRKLSLITADAERSITGQEVVSMRVQQLVGDEGRRLLHKQAQERERKLRQKETAGASGNSMTDEEEEQFAGAARDTLDAPFFWVDMSAPPCKVTVSIVRPGAERRFGTTAASSSSNVSYTDVLESPGLAMWKVGKVLHRVAENSGLHPHNLEVRAAFPERFFAHLGDAPYGAEEVQNFNNNNNHHHDDCDAQLVSRHRPLLDLLKMSRHVHLQVCLARPPVCCIKVVEAHVAEMASHAMYAKANRKNLQLQQRDSSRLTFNDSSAAFGDTYNHNNQNSSSTMVINGGGGGYSVQQRPVAELYSANPLAILESGSRRIISLRHANWASTLADVHRDCQEALAPLRGRGFLCLDPTVIQTWPRDSIAFGNTGTIGGGQVPVFAPEMTLRQIARLSQEQQAQQQSGNGGGGEGEPTTVKLYIIVNSQGDAAERAPRPLSKRVQDTTILQEADRARWDLLAAVFPHAKQLRGSADLAVRFKKHNVDSRPPPPTSIPHRRQQQQQVSFVSNYQQQQQQQQQQLPLPPVERRVQFGNDSVAAPELQQQQQQQFVPEEPRASFGLVSPPRAFRPPPNRSVVVNNNNNNNSPSSSFAAAASPSDSFAGTSPLRRSGSPTRRGAVPVVAAAAAASSNLRPNSPDHSEGVEAFVAVPVASSSYSRSGGSEVIRLLLPDGFFPLRRLKRFLKLQAEAGSAGALSPRKEPGDYRIYFGSELLMNDDDDVKKYVNSRTKTVFFNAV